MSQRINSIVSAIAYIILSLVLIGLAILRAQAQSDTCLNGDQLTINTSTKRYQCITPGALPAGTGTTMIVANDTVTGTTVNKFAKLTGAPSKAIVSSNGDTENAMGIVTGGAGTTGNATITILGQVLCVFDGATTAGNYVTIAATGGGCHDGGSSYPTSGAAYGKVLSTNGGAGTYLVQLMTPDVAFQNAGNGKSKPGGSPAQVQYNNTNVFAGITNATTDGTTLTVTLPKVITGLNDTNGNPFIAISPTASAVDSITITNGASGAPGTVDISTSGSDSNINLTLTPKGTGQTLSSKVIGVTSAGVLKTHMQSVGLANASTSAVQWSNSSASTGTIDAAIFRNAANILEVNTGSSTVFAWLKVAGRNRVTAQFDKTANTTLADITGTSRALLTGQSWGFEFEANYDADVTGGQKWTVVYSSTTSAIEYYILSICDATNLNVITARQTTSGGSSGQAGCTAGRIRISGNLTTTGAGNLSIQFAQNAANGTSSVRAAGSFFNVWPTSN